MRDRKRISFEDSHRFFEGEQQKLCSNCNQWYPCNEIYFYKNPSNKKDGLNPKCKQCNISNSTKWNKENYEKTLTFQKQRNDKPQNKEKRRLSEKKRRENGLLRDWQRKNKDKLKLYRQKRFNKSHEITQDEWSRCLEYFEWKCAYCDMTQEIHFAVNGQQLHRDHVIHDGSNFIDNCVPACKECNSSKHDKELTEWYNKKFIHFDENRFAKVIQWVTKDWIIFTE
ncbi:HNH endonuclease [Paenibacillus sp. EKM202P]|uniref:HNH endonuclease n=1 Tax=Paenibacillus sp. EKM202P TaxID=1683670 RepID=UPI0013EAC458|nr:HNH endonuclease [Paenibacillus sp. EKM202P]KAF6565418.1 HNH endonuclease [Paenibacillus sp. EKM202P]KAF6569257.1 HNH endonuclease [Paenibacillus sp. EKM207P]